jgi:Bacterial regulatory proteins, luxR family
VAEGLTNQRIADQLFVGTHTVAFHLRQAFRKLDIRSRVDLARIALEHARPEAAQTPRLGDVSGPRGGEADPMLTTGIQSLPEPLAWAQAAYHHGIARLAPASAGRPARRVERFASSAEFVLHDPDAAQRPPALAKDLRTVPRLGTLLPQVPRGTMALMGGDFGNTQMADPATGSRPLATQASFGRELLVCFAVAEDVPSTSGRPPGKARRRPSPASTPTRASRRIGRLLPLQHSVRSNPRPWPTTPVT